MLFSSVLFDDPSVSEPGELVDYTTEPFQVDDLDEIVRLHHRLLPRQRGANKKYLVWKYFENPHIDDPLISVVRYGKEIVAMVGLVGMAWRRVPDLEPEIMPQIDDLIVHPVHQRKGLSKELARGVKEMSASRGHRAMVSMSGGDASSAIALARGWVEVRELDRIRLIRGDRNLRRKGHIRRFGIRRTGPPVDRTVDGVIRTVPEASSRISVSAEPDVDAMSALSEAVGRHASTRNIDFLRWRLNNPDRVYRFVYWRDTALRGYMIVGWGGEHRECAMIVDHCCEDVSVFADLLGAMTRIPSGHVELMASTLPKGESDVAHRLGFQSDPDHAFGMRRFLMWPHASNTPVDTIPKLASAWRVDLIDTLQG